MRIQLGRKIISVLGVLLVACVLLFLGPLSVLAFGDLNERGSWRTASRATSGQAPLPDQHPEAVVQVYAARTLGWRGAFGVHTWVATKGRNETAYRVHHVIGWRYYYGGSAVVSQTGTPDFYWFGARPTILVDHRGPEAQAMIAQIEAAVAEYPYADWYRVWPGPNSNSFTAHIGRNVPGLRLDLPPNALGKDFLGVTKFVAPTPSGTGWQLNFLGVLGLALAWEEGIELNILGLNAGIDWNDAALRLPGIGRVTWSDLF